MATQVIRGNGSPEGFVKASRGTFYINVQSSSVFVKIKGDNTTSNGWRALNIRGFYNTTEDPEGVLAAPKYATCYNSENDTLFIQMRADIQNLNTGWISLNKHETIIGRGNPNTENKIESMNIGDIYIDEDNLAIYVHTDIGWENIVLIVIDSTDVMLRLSELMTNTTSIIRQYYNMFFNPEPMDIELSQYDENSVLQTFKVPNRAKDTVTLIGDGSPEGSVFASAGQFYLDVTDNVPYIKTSPFDKDTGWISLRLPMFHEPLEYNPVDNSVSVRFDDIPTENSSNLLSSHTILNELDKIRNGNSEELFSVAEPTLNEHATSKNYVDNLYATLFGYDPNTKTLYVNAPITSEKSEAYSMIMGYRDETIDGILYTPMFGRGLATVFNLSTPLVETESTELYIHSDIPCTVRFTAVNGAMYEVILTASEPYIRCFDGSEEMAEGITQIQVVDLEYLDSVLLENVKEEIYNKLRIDVIDLYEGTEEEV